MSRSSPVSKATGRVPTQPNEIQQVFTNHYDYFRSKDGEIAHQQRTGESQIRREYSGRVVFELLQNAIDRAESTVKVQLVESDHAHHEYVLIVANDGDGIRVNPEYKYDNPPDAGEDGSRRPDFNALCSLHTSNKSPEESIGTKGIGFRSVFSVSDHVRVWSQFEQSAAWWGLEMHSPLKKDTWQRRRDKPAINRGIEQFLDDETPPLSDNEPRPSYHFPLPLYADTAPSVVNDPDGINTAISLPVANEHKDTLASRIQEFTSQHLYFVGLDHENRDLTVTFKTPNRDPATFSCTTWPKTARSGSDHNSWLISEYASRELESKAEEAEHDVSEPGAAVAWPPKASTDEDSAKPRTATIYGYLPTLIDAPFGIDIHADFQLSIDRTNIRLDDEQIGPYNRTLLEIAAELHLFEAIRTVDIELATEIEWAHIGPEDVGHNTDKQPEQLRPDFWEFLDPSRGDSDSAAHVINHVRKLLFPDNDSQSQDSQTYSYWSRLATAYFSTRDEWRVATYDEFWTASTAWLDRLCSTKTRQKNWRRTALAMCDALRENEAPVAPVVLTESPEQAERVPAVPLPERGEQVGQGGNTERHERKLFLRSGDTHLSLPEAMTTDGRAVTAYDFASDLHTGSPNALGTTDFNRWEVLQELRQLPNANVTEPTKPLAGSPDQAVRQQQELISFAAELYTLDTGTSHTTPDDLTSDGPGWRALSKPSKPARRAGRAIATLYLPTNKGDWAPVRQLTRDQVDEQKLGPLPASISLDDFLTFLGVAPEPPADGCSLTLVEGGPTNGVVAHRDTPPELAAPGRGTLEITLGDLPGIRDEPEPEAWYDSVTAAEDWLLPLLEAESTTDPEAEETASPERLDLLDPLATHSWYPVDDAVSDYATSPLWGDECHAVPPRQLTLLTAQQPYLAELLWSVDRDAANKPLLAILGANTSTDREDLAEGNADPALRLLTQLRQLENPERLQDQPKVQTALIQLFERVLEAIVRSNPDAHQQADIDVLIYDRAGDGEPRALTDRPLTWRPAATLTDDEAWIPATTTDQETMRRLFPDEPLVAAVIGPEVLQDYQPLADYHVSITKTVQTTSLPDESELDPSTITHELANELSEIIPKLLALAGADQQLTVNLSAQADQWGPGIFKPVANVWREYTAHLGHDNERTRHKYRGEDGVALLNPSPTPERDTTPRIQFDPLDSDTHPYPPLVEFGRPLAELLLDDNQAQAASLFERGLQTVASDNENLDQLVERRDATPLIHSYEQRINPLDDAPREDLLTKTQHALDTFDIELTTSAITRLRTLTPTDIGTSATPPDITAKAVNKELETLDLSPRQKQFQPRLTCKPEHKRNWNEWIDAHQDQLIPYLLDLLRPDTIEDIEEETLIERLTDHVQDEELHFVEFEPESAVRRWLRSEGLDDDQIPNDLIEQARQFVPKYDRVDEINSATDSGWTRQSLTAPNPSQEEHGTVDQEEEIEAMRARKAVGTNAEYAALEQVVTQTDTLLKDLRDHSHIETIDGVVEDPWDVLSWPIPDDGVTARNLTTARDEYKETQSREALKQGLHISNVWDGAGYDLLGLAQDELGRLQPVRYEIKAVSGTSTTVGIHLSNRQLSLYSKIHEETTNEPRYLGDWRLWGIENGGSAVDLTEELRELPKHALEDLRREGFQHDGLILRVTRTR